MRVQLRLPLPDRERDMPLVLDSGRPPAVTEDIRLIPGEEELGPQQHCRKCQEWWPAGDTEFWPSEASLRGVCRACFNDRKVRLAARRRRRVADLPSEVAEVRREYWRDRQQRWRERERQKRHAK